MKLKTVQQFMLEELQNRFYETFGCHTVITNGPERTRALQDSLGGPSPELPYAFLKLVDIGPSSGSYNAGSIGRRGLPVAVTDDQNNVIMVRVLPKAFRFEVEYYTDKFNLSVDGSVLSYASRWMFAHRFGYLKFEINYGKLVFKIGAVLDENLSIPERANVTDSPTPYPVTSNLVVEGWVSEPYTDTQGVVNTVVTSLDLGPDSQTWFYPSSN